MAIARDVLSQAAIERYCQGVAALAGRKDRALADMERLAAEEGFPIVGPLVGGLLDVLVRARRPRRALEMGSGFGYSTYWIARALPPGGEVHYTDLSLARRIQAEEFLRRGPGGLIRKVRFHVGHALDVLPALPGRFDFIFLDLDKADYPRAYRAAKRRLAPGGLLVADNVLWGGQVIRGPFDADTQALQRYTRLVRSDRGLSTTILPLRDGVAVSVRR